MRSGHSRGTCIVMDQILSLDRVAGENTIRALNSYKKSRNMKQDGICDAAVWKDLLAI